MCAVLWSRPANVWAMALAVGVGCAVLGPLPAVAVTPEPTSGLSAEELVNEALCSEIYGHDSRRRELLEEALDKAVEWIWEKWHEWSDSTDYF